MPPQQAASLPFTSTADQAARTVRYWAEQRPNRSLAALTVADRMAVKPPLDGR